MEVSGPKAFQTELLWINYCVAFLSKLLTEPLTKNIGPERENEGDDGVPRQGHHGQGLQDVPFQDRGCRRR